MHREQFPDKFQKYRTHPDDLLTIRRNILIIEAFHISTIVDMKDRDRITRYINISDSNNTYSYIEMLPGRTKLIILGDKTTIISDIESGNIIVSVDVKSDKVLCLSDTLILLHCEREFKLWNIDTNSILDIPFQYLGSIKQLFKIDKEYVLIHMSKVMYLLNIISSNIIEYKNDKIENILQMSNNTFLCFSDEITLLEINRGEIEMRKICSNTHEVEGGLSIGGNYTILSNVYESYMFSYNPHGYDMYKMYRYINIKSSIYDNVRDIILSYTNDSMLALLKIDRTNHTLIHNKDIAVKNGKLFTYSVNGDRINEALDNRNIFPISKNILSVIKKFITG